MYKEWYRSNNFGQLYKMKDLVYGNEPVFSIVTNDENKCYLVETIDSSLGEYVIAECGSIDIMQMFVKKQTIYETLKGSKKVAHTTFDDDYVLFCDKTIEGNELDDNLLPEKGMYFDSFSKDVDEFIERFIETLYKKRIDYIYNYRRITAYRILAFDADRTNMHLNLIEVDEKQMPNQTANTASSNTNLAYS